MSFSNMSEERLLLFSTVQLYRARFSAGATCPRALLAPLSLPGWCSTAEQLPFSPRLATQTNYQLQSALEHALKSWPGGCMFSWLPPYLPRAARQGHTPRKHEPPSALTGRFDKGVGTRGTTALRDTPWLSLSVCSGALQASRAELPLQTGYPLRAGVALHCSFPGGVSPLMPAELHQCKFGVAQWERGPCYFPVSGFFRHSQSCFLAGIRRGDPCGPFWPCGSMVLFCCG